MKTPFLGGSYEARSRNLAYNRLVNLYHESAPPDAGKDAGALLGCPGLEQFQQIGDGPIRGVLNYFNATLFIVSGGTLYYTDSLSVAPAPLGGIAGNGLVSMCANLSGLVFIVADQKAYVYDLITSTLTERTDLPLQGGTCDFLDQQFIFHEYNTAYVRIFDGVDYDPTDVATAESEPSHVNCVIADHREAWIFKDKATEVWADTGNADFPFEPIPGAAIPQGCAARFTPKRLDNSIFWLGRNDHGHGVVWRANGYTPARVSTHAIEKAIDSYGDISDAFAMTYQQEGHSFYVLTFPTAGKTWAFDVSTGLWHERASMDPETGALGRWRPNCLAFFQGEVVAGDYRTGKLFTLSLDNYTDGNYGPVVGFSPAMYETNSGSNDKLAAARVIGGPTGYLTGDVLTLAGGTYTRPAQIMVAVDTGGGLGAANVVSVVDAGDYTVTPSDPVSTTGGSGSGLTVLGFWTTDDAIEIAEESGATYTTVPTITIDSRYGTGAEATASIQLIAAKASGFGSGYQVGDVLTLSGGTFTTAAQVKVVELSGGAPNTLAIVNPGVYSVRPTGFITLTGGSGTSATCTGFWGIADPTLVSGGTEYSQVPEVTISGPGVNASLTALVDASTNLIPAIRSWRAIPQGLNDLKRTTHHHLILDAEMGVGVDGGGQGSDPQISLRWSDDGGHTWSNEHFVSMGAIGETGRRAVWRRLGSTVKLRDRVYEIQITDPVKRAFIGAHIEMSPNAS